MELSEEELIIEYFENAFKLSLCRFKKMKSKKDAFFAAIYSKDLYMKTGNLAWYVISKNLFNKVGKGGREKYRELEEFHNRPKIEKF